MRHDAEEPAPEAGAPRFVVHKADGTVRAHGRAAHATLRDDASPTYGQYLLTLPLSERPTCPYETSEYNAVVTDVIRRANARAEDSLGLHIAHQVALLTVMVSRAARALATKPFTEKMEQSAENYYMSVDKPSAALQAFERLSRELRRWIHLVEREYQTLSADPATEREHELRRQCDTGHSPDHAATLDLTTAIAKLEADKLTANHHAQLREMDKQIMDTLLTRFAAKHNRTEETERTEKLKDDETGGQDRGGRDLGGRVSSRAEDG